jgi:ribosomal protein L35AE/L33A
VPARPFGGYARVTFPPRPALSRLALEPPWLGALLSVLVRLRVTAMLGRRAGAEERVQRLGAWLRRRYEGRDWYGIVVEVEGARGAVRASLVRCGQATGTAIGAAAVVRALAEGEVKQPGIWLAEEVVAPEPFFKYLAARGLVPTVETLEGSPLVEHGKSGG